MSALVALAAAGFMGLAARLRLATREGGGSVLAAGAGVSSMDLAARAGASSMDVAARLGLATRDDAMSVVDAAGDARVSRGASPARATLRPDAAAQRAIAAAPIALDDPQIALGAALAISGHDAGAPRAIEVWRIAGTRAVRVATGTSRADGSLDLPPFVLPAGVVTLVAAPRGAGVDSRAASAPVVASRDPSAPRLVARAAVAESIARVTLEAAEPGGSIVVARASQQEIGRTPVVAGVDASRARLEISVALAPEDAELLVAQEIPDGRRSPWRHVALDRQPQGD